MISPFKMTSGLSLSDSDFEYAISDIHTQASPRAPSGAIQSQPAAALHLAEEHERRTQNGTAALGRQSACTRAASKTEAVGNRGG